MRWPILAVAIGGCYSPSLEKPCEISCANSPCPSHLTCASNGMCVDPTTMTCDPIGGDAGPPDAPQICSGTDAPPFMKLCAPESSTMLFGDGTFLDTDNSNLCTTIDPPATGGHEACLVAASSITITGNFRPHGSRPLVLYAIHALTINGIVDVAGHVMTPTDRPAGSPASGTLCSALPPGTSMDTGGGGGGAGGGLGATGGSGGAAAGSAPGANASFVGPSTLFRGGCDGSAGGDFIGTSVHIPGVGGGAIYLAAGDVIQFGTGGQVNASGGGAGTAQAHNGGAGGGSGGMIIIDTPMISGSPSVFALGGGGSAGSTASPSATGGDATAANAPGLGGLNPGNGGNGGTGGGGVMAAGSVGSPGVINATGGGGGGGGIGVTHVRPAPSGPSGGFNPQPN